MIIKQIQKNETINMVLQMRGGRDRKYNVYVIFILFFCTCKPSNNA
jgi:hypothetical protein